MPLLYKDIYNYIIGLTRIINDTLPHLKTLNLNHILKAPFAT